MKELVGDLQVEAPPGYVFDCEASPVVLVHLASGMRLLATPLQPSGIEDEMSKNQLLFHYTGKEAFDAISASREIWATLRERNINTKDTCFGDGVYMTARAPHEF